MHSGRWGELRSDDGRSRPFQPDSTDPRQVVAEVLARRDGWAEIRPGHWRDAGAVVKALKAEHMIRPLRERPKPETRTDDGIH